MEVEEELYQEEVEVEEHPQLLVDLILRNQPSDVVYKYK